MLLLNECLLLILKKEKKFLLLISVRVYNLISVFLFLTLCRSLGWDGCDLDANTTGEVPAQPYWYEAAPAEFQDYLQGRSFCCV
jgi:hypothetical protein